MNDATWKLNPFAMSPEDFEAIVTDCDAGPVERWHDDASYAAYQADPGVTPESLEAELDDYFSTPEGKKDLVEIEKYNAEMKARRRPVSDLPF